MTLAEMQARICELECHVAHLERVLCDYLREAIREADAGRRGAHAQAAIDARRD